MQSEENVRAKYARDQMLSAASRRIRDAWTSKFLSYNALTDAVLEMQLMDVAGTISAANEIISATQKEVEDFERTYFGSQADNLKWLAGQVLSMYEARLKGLTREKRKRERRKAEKLADQKAKEDRAASIKKLPVYIVECFWCEGTGVRQDEMSELTNNCGHCAAVGHFLLNEPPKAKTVMDAVYEQEPDGIYRVVEDPAMARDRRLNKPTRRRFLTSKEAGAKLQQFPLGKRPAKRREIQLDDHSE